MTYGQTAEGVFVSRPNRFIAHVDIAGKREICHVKNTGRCKELLVPGARIVLEKSKNPLRKTAYDIIAVYKGDRLINMDSQAPNRVFFEWAKTAGEFADIAFIKPECVYKNSRFDFYLEGETRRVFAEVKGVTLEEDGVVMFPDAPTLRGQKHLTELSDAVRNGYEAYVVFVVQMENCCYFTPNRKTDEAFAKALEQAISDGVRVLCFTCKTTPNSLVADTALPVKL